MNDNEKNNTPQDSYEEEDVEYISQLLAERKKANAINLNQQQSETVTPETSIPKPKNVPPPPKRRYERRFPVIPVMLALAAAAVIIISIFAFSSSQTAGTDPSDTKNFGESSDIELDFPEWITVNLLTVNQYSRPGIKLEEVNGAVVHYVANPGTTAEQNRRYFEGLAQSKNTYGSSNFIIGIDGEILMIVPPDEIAYCSNDRNYDTISIECCHPDETGEFTQETYDSLIKLLSWLSREYNFKSTDIIRHYDITEKLCPIYYVNNPGKWQKLLQDVEEYE